MKKEYIIAIAGLIIGLIAGAYAFSTTKIVETQAPTGYANQYDGFVVSKTITSSAISTTTAADLTNPVTGNLLVDNVVISSDSPGLAGCTSFNILASGNTYGTTVVASSAISSLATSSTVDLNTATTKQRIVLENGAKLQYKGIGGTCSGAGKAKITVFLKKAAANSTIAD